MFELSNEKFSDRRTWGCAIEQMHCPNADMLYLFDQSGYDLCPLEQEYAKVNMGEVLLVLLSIQGLAIARL